MFFNSWADLGSVLVKGLIGYVGLILILRLSGKRTLSKMNAFDLVVTVALGSTLATLLLSKSVAIAEGLTAFTLLVLLQFGITWLSVRSSTVSRLVKADPTLLAYRGALLPTAMRQMRVVETEIYAALRGAGVASLAAVEAVVLETDGSFTVIPRPPEEHAATALRGVPGAAV
jgi:uncharacterized membrane protein YcaP (DUF421 family)